MDREARQATVHEVAKSQTRLSDQHFTGNHSTSEQTGLVRNSTQPPMVRNSTQPPMVRNSTQPPMVHNSTQPPMVCFPMTGTCFP